MLFASQNLTEFWNRERKKKQGLFSTVTKRQEFLCFIRSSFTEKAGIEQMNDCIKCVAAWSLSQREKLDRYEKRERGGDAFIQSCQETISILDSCLQNTRHPFVFLFPSPLQIKCSVQICSFCLPTWRGSHGCRVVNPGFPVWRSVLNPRTYNTPAYQCVVATHCCPLSQNGFWPVVLRRVNARAWKGGSPRNAFLWRIQQGLPWQPMHLIPWVGSFLQSQKWTAMDVRESQGWSYRCLPLYSKKKKPNLWDSLNEPNFRLSM